MIDWSRPIETNETPPRKATVTGTAHSVVDFVTVKIEGYGYHHPAGEYAAFKSNGFVRGNLAIRNAGVEVISKRSQQIGGVTVNFAVGRIRSKRNGA